MRVALLVCMLAATGALAQQQNSCPLENAGSGTVRAVLDDRTFVLTDGREVRLAAIEVTDGHAALEQMLRNREVTLKRLGDKAATAACWRTPSSLATRSPHSISCWRPDTPGWRRGSATFIAPDNFSAPSMPHEPPSSVCGRKLVSRRAQPTTSPRS
jgi:hypothetical protein